MPWSDELPEGLRDAPFIGKAESLEDAVGKLAHAAKLVGTSIRIPGESTSDSDKAEFYQKLAEIPDVARLPQIDDADGMTAIMAKLGMPSEVTEYAIPEVEGYSWDENIANDLRTYALAAGLTKTQFESMAKNIGAAELTAAGTVKTVTEETRKALRLDWGETLEEREALIRGWLAKSEAPEELSKSFQDGELDLSTMNWLLAVAKQFKGEVKPISSDGKGGEAPLDPLVARTKIQELLNNPAYFDSAHPLNASLILEMVRLQGLANKEEAA